VRMLFACRPSTGHYLPLMPLATACKSRGHAVAFATGEPVASLARRAGFECFIAGLSDQDSRAALAKVGISLRDLAPSQMRPVTFGQWFSAIDTPPRLIDLERICAEFKPDLLIHEVAELATPLAGAAAGLPWVTVGFGPLLQPDVARLAGDGVAPLWTARGLLQPAWAGLYQHLYVDPCPPALQVPEIEALPARIGLGPEGASTLSKPRRRLGAARVYVTFGTLWNSGPAAVDRLRLTVFGSASAGVEVTVTVGRDNDPALLGEFPSNVRVEQFVPQDQVLPDCACVVAHGGAGTLLGALAWGVPLLILPQFADQFYNAERAVHAGVALELAPGEISADTVAACVQKLLDDAAFAGRAATVRDEMAQMPSLDQVLDRIEALSA
jgi:UDP:flavonoid glycosyltransferase YjiC (YdhE family)